MKTEENKENEKKGKWVIDSLFHVFGLKQRSSNCLFETEVRAKIVSREAFFPQKPSENPHVCLRIHQDYA